MKRLSSKTISDLSKLYGLLGILFGSGLILFQFIQRMFFSADSFPSTPQMDFKLYFTALNKLWLTYIPFMILIGGMFFLSGYFISKNYKYGKMVLILSSTLNIIWYILYAVASWHDILPLILNAFSPNTFMISYTLTGMVMCAYPLFLLFYLPFVKE
jgi:hypothetical protein